MVRLPPISVVCLLSLAAASPAWTQERSANVLTIHSGAVDYPVNPVLDAGIREALFAPGAPRLAYFTEFLDFDRFPLSRTSSAFRDYVRHKYARRRIDVVIAARREAVQFVLDHGAALFPEASLVLVSGHVGHPHRDDHVACVRIGSAYSATLKLALDLHPDVRRVYVVASAPDPRAVRQVRDELQPFSTRVRLTYLNPPTLRALQTAVKAVPAGSLVLYVWYQSQDAVYVADPADPAELVATAARVPVYGAFDLLIGSGVVGGMVSDTRGTGVRAGEIARRILSGTPARDIPVVDAPLNPVFDWRQLQRRAIAPDRLPRDAEIRFRAPTAWEAHGTQIAVAIGVLAAQMVLIVALLTQHRRRRRAEDVLRVRETTLRASYRRIRQLAVGLMQAQEATRVAMARDLHDDICQGMVGVAMAIDDLTNSGGRIQDARTQYALAKLHCSVLEIADRIRRISHELHPASLQLLGLAAAVKTHCLEVEKRHHVRVSLQTAGDLKQIHPDVALCLFRIAQEALRNAVAHGAARRIQASVVRFGVYVELSVVDDGRGFDVEAVRRDGRGLGLVSLEERAHGAGGEVLVTSAPGQGTSIIVRVPAGESFEEPFPNGAQRGLPDPARPSVEPWIVQPL
jgi:signal transduction histidine kinase